MNPKAVFTWLDWAVLIGYFLGITWFGIWISRKTKTSGTYFLGDRKLPWWIMVGQAFGTGTHAESPVAQAAIPRRPESSAASAILSPSPSSPMR